MINTQDLKRMALELSMVLAVALVVLVASPLDAWAGQGGGAAAESNVTPFIVGGLAVVMLGAGIGLVVSRRKK